MSKKNKDTKKHNPEESTQQEQSVNEKTQSAADNAQAAAENAAPAPETDTLRAELEAANDKYLRLMAEFDNYRRRTARERLELIETADKEVLTGFLPVVDDCERALDTLRNSEASEAAVEGTELILNKLMSYLKSKGVEKIDAKGKPFNTDEHEAVAQFPAPAPEQKNIVIDVTQNGYKLRGKVIRYAKVVVGI
ncbi:MAG: nucleotide exchange factor GrpE [Bacteroidales bacterium]|nr:nucleotide exchange factor GrpE [Bacteroidales bacterium]